MPVQIKPQPNTVSVRQVCNQGQSLQAVSQINQLFHFPHACLTAVDTHHSFFIFRHSIQPSGKEIKFVHVDGLAFQEPKIGRFIPHLTDTAYRYNIFYPDTFHAILYVHVRCRQSYIYRLFPIFCSNLHSTPPVLRCPPHTFPTRMH